MQAGERRLTVGMLGVDENFFDVFLSGDGGRAFPCPRRIRRSIAGSACLATRERSSFSAPRKNAMGKLLTLGNDIFEVVGVVSGVMLGGLASGRLLFRPRP